MACVIVLGCYRSGTSAVAGILHHLGIPMGKEFDEPSHANPKGYYEDVEFKRLYDQLANGKGVDRLVEILISVREIEQKFWGVKDPKLCLLLTKFVELLGNVDHKLIVVRRPKEKILDSMARAIGYSKPDDYQRYVEYYLDRMEANAKNYTGHKLEVNFEDLLRNPKDHIEKIAFFVGKEPNKAALNFITSKEAGS